MKHDTLYYTNFNFEKVAVEDLSFFVVDGINIISEDKELAVSKFFPFFNKDDSRFDKSVIDNFKSKDLVLAVYGYKESIENGFTLSVSILNKKGKVLKNLGSNYAYMHYKKIEDFLK